MYEAGFWPENVGTKRFDFKKHKNFLDDNKAAVFLSSEFKTQPKISISNCDDL